MIVLGPESVIWLVEASPRDPDTGLPVVHRWSDVDYMTRATDSPAHTGYDALVADPMNLRVQGYKKQGGTVIYGGVASVEIQAVELFNAATDEEPEVRQLTYLADWGWDGAEVVIRRGTTEYDAVAGAWVPVALASFETILTGVALDFDPGADGRAQLRVHDPARRIRVPAQRLRFTGFGACVRFGGASGSGGVIAHDAAFNVETGALTVAALVRLRAAAISGSEFIATKRGSGTQSWVLRCATPDITTRLDTSTGNTQLNLGAVDAERWVWIGQTWDGANVTAFARYLHGDDWLSTATGARGGTLTTNTNPIYLARDHSSLYAELDMAEFRWYARSFTLAELETRLSAPIDTEGTDFGDDDGLSYVPFEDRAFDFASDLVAGRDAELTGHTWLATGEGGAELAGRPKPFALGSVYQVPAVPVDRQLASFAVHHRGVDQLRYLYAGLVALTPTRSVTSSQVFFNAPRAQIRCLDTDLLFVPDQIITVSGSVSNNGDKGVLLAEQNRRVVATSGASLFSEAPGPSVTIATKAGTEGWRESGGMAEILDAFSGEVTADVVGDAAAGSSAADVVEYILTEMGPGLSVGDLDGVALLGTAPVGVWGDAEIDASELVDAIAHPLGVAVVPGADGKILFRTFALAAPVDEFAKEEVRGLERVADTLAPPPTQVQVGYRRAWRVTTNPPESVSGWVVDFAAQEFRTVTMPKVADPILAALHPLSEVLRGQNEGPLPSMLDLEADARAAALAIYTRAQWRLYRCTVELRGWGLQIGDTVRIYHPDHGMADGVDLIVAAYEKIARERVVVLDLARPA